jgi:hypothetical protein
MNLTTKNSGSYYIANNLRLAGRRSPNLPTQSPNGWLLVLIVYTVLFGVLIMRYL